MNPVSRNRKKEKKQMHRISPEELAAAHRIFSRIESLVGPYYGLFTYDRVEKFISENRWLMFPEYHINSLREGAEMPLPNMYISFDDEIKDDNESGMAQCNVGVTYHNVQAMLVLWDILRRRTKANFLLNVVHSFGSAWDINIQHKTKTDSIQSTPRYSTFQSFKPQEIVVPNQIVNAIVDSNRNLLHRGDIYPETGTPVLWDVTVFGISISTNADTFDVVVKKAFDAFLKLLNLRS